MITYQRNGHQKEIGTAAAIGQGERNQPPDLTLQDQIAIKAKHVIQDGIAGDHADEIYQRAAQGNIQHQVGNALVSMHKAETLEFTAKVFQGCSTPIS